MSVPDESGELPYACDVCDKLFPQKDYLSRHMRIHTVELPYACDVCDKSFSEKSNLSRHMRIHTGELQYTCNACGKYFSHKHNLSAHMRTHTGELPYACDVCDKSFSQKSSLTSHMRTHTGKFPYTCDVCDKSFSNNSHLTNHMRIHTGELPFTCDLCAKSFSHKYSLTSHMRTHTGELPYTCDVCDKSFSRKSSLTIHMRTHTGELPYTCDVCDKSFSNKSSLNSHMRIHTGELPYTCDVCDKSFSHKCSLTSHVWTHTGELPYTCDVRDKSFSRKYDLNRHTRIHTGELSYTCDVCDKSFSHKSCLTNHMRTHTARTTDPVHIRSHTGESPFSCGMCGSCFKTAIAIKRHMVTHTGKKHYMCVLCFVNFKGARGLNAHMKQVHHAERQRHLTDIKSIKYNGIPPTLKVYKNVTGADFNVSYMMNLKYYDIREEFASDLSIFRKRAPVLVGSKAGVSDIDEDFGNSRRKTKASVTPGQLGRMVLGEYLKVKKSQNKVKIRNVPDAVLLQDDAQAESEVFPVVDSGVETRATDQHNAVEVIKDPAVDYTITTNDGTVFEMGVGPTGTVEEEIEYEVQYIGNDASNMANPVMEAGQIVEDGVNYCNTVISDPLQNAEVGNDSSMKDKGVHNSADLYNCIALTENPDICQCRLSDMREGRYGASPHVIKVFEDGTVIDVTTMYQNCLPVTKS